MRTAGTLATSLDTLAALAAYLRVESEQIEVDPAVRTLLETIARDLVGDPTQIPDATRTAIVGLSRAFLYQASDLIENPGRSAGWHDTDEKLLQSIGQLSMGIVDAVRAAAARHDPLREMLDRAGAAFFDIGTGAGWLAIAMARAYPRLRIIGLDIFPPALELAGRNITAAGLTDRIEVRAEDAQAMMPETADVIWLPLPFLALDVAQAVIARAASALRPGGWLLPGTFPGPGESLAERLMTLRTLRSGGHAWGRVELVAELEAAGFTGVGEVPRTWAAPVRLFTGQKPPANAAPDRRQST
jgi:SAM-dependent methyltransferase